MQGRIIMGRCLVVLAVLAFSAGAVSAANLTVNFDAGTSPFTTFAGSPTVSTTQAHSGGYSLYIAPGDDALLSIPSPAGGGTVTMWIYDLGKWATNDSNFAGAGSANGWRAGLTGSVTQDSAHLSLMQRTYLGSSGGYAFGRGSGDGGTFGGWFSPNWSSTNRQVVSLSPNPNDESVGVGEWSQWSFTFFPDGNAVINLCNGSGVPIPSAMTAVIPGGATGIFLYGGDSAALGGLYVDDIVITTVPEPATMALLGAGALLAVLRRNRRK